MNKDLGLICDAAANIGAPSDISQLLGISIWLLLPVDMDQKI
jgi:hypothetical protein